MIVVRIDETERRDRLTSSDQPNRSCGFRKDAAPSEYRSLRRTGDIHIMVCGPQPGSLLIQSMDDDKG